MINERLVNQVVMVDSGPCTGGETVQGPLLGCDLCCIQQGWNHWLDGPGFCLICP